MVLQMQIGVFIRWSNQRRFSTR